MKVVKKIINNILNNSVLIFTLFICSIELIFKIVSNNLYFDYSFLRIFLSSYFISILVNLIRKNLLKKIVMGVLSFIITIYALCQLGFYNFLGNYMSVNASSQLGKVSAYVQDYFHSFHIRYYFILIPFFLFLIYLIFWKKKKSTLKKPYLIIVPVLVIFYTLTVTLNGMQNKFQYITNLELIKYPSIPSIAVNQFGVTFYGVLDLKSKFFEVEETEALEIEIEESITDQNNEALKYIIDHETDDTYNTINKYFYNQTTTEENEYTGVFEGKNLIVIMMESIGDVINRPEYFPNLAKLYNGGLTFTNNYSPRNTCATGNNEFSALTSLYTINNLCSANEYKENTYMESMFNIFNDSGYTTTSYHDYTEQYYFRSTIHKNMGSGAYYGVEDLGIEYDETYEEWPSDVELINKSYDIFTKSDSFMTFLTTVTAHQPYTSSEFGDKYLSLFKDLKVSTSVKRYLSKVKELDNAIGVLLEKLEQDNLLEDTVIVLFGDHYPYGLKTSEYQKLFDYNLSENMEIEQTPFVIYNSEIEGKKFDNYTTYMNILPTLANLFGLSYDARYYMGEDLFSSNYSDIAVFTDGSWQSKYAYYDAGTSKISYIQKEFRYTNQEILNINQMVNQKISISNSIISKDYFTYLEEKLKEYEDSKISE